MDSIRLDDIKGIKVIAIIELRTLEEWIQK